jgi:hypothetical protein
MPYDHHHPHPSVSTHPEEPITVLGETTFRGRHQRFGLLGADRLRHLYVLGKTGSGKSTLLLTLLAQDLARGHGLAVLDPHGDLAAAAAALLPRHRTNQVLLFDPADAAFPVSFNVFRQGRERRSDSALLTSSIVSVFHKQWSAFWGPRLEHVLRSAILAVADDPRATLLFLYRFLTDEQLQAKVVERVTDPVVRQFWTREFPAYSKSLRAEALAPVLNKLGAFVSIPQVRRIVGQERSRIDLVEFMDRRFVLFASLATGAIGEDAAHLLGGLLLTAMQLAAGERTRGGPPFFVYADEFQHFVTDSLATMLSEARKFGLGLVLAHQYLGQLPQAMRDAVLGNVGSIALFRLGAQDARVLADELAPEFSAADLSQLGPYQMAVKLLVRGRQLAPFSARALAPPIPPATADQQLAALRDQSRLRFARPRAEVDAAIKRAMQ